MWRCVTSLVAHRDLAHLAINSGLLVAVTPFAVRRLCAHRYLVVYVVGGVSANALRYAAGGRHGGGASGAIVAVVSTAAVAALLDRGVMLAAIGAATVAATLVGLAAAHAFSDNHVLAAGIGGAVALSAGPARRRFWPATAAVGAVAVGAMITRVLLST